VAHPPQTHAVQLQRPRWSRGLRERPTAIKGGRAWDRTVEQTIECRQRHNVSDAGRPLGLEPHGREVSPAQRRARRHAERAIGRLRNLAGGHTERPDRQGGLVATKATI
jgi:hypothetical protein